MLTNPRLLLRAAAICAALFVLLAALVMLGVTEGFDRALLMSVHNAGPPFDPIGPWWMAILARDLTALGGQSLTALIGGLAWALFRAGGRAREGLAMLIAAGGALLLQLFLKPIFGRARPELTAHGVDTHSLAFPSGHGMMSAALWGALAMCAAVAAGPGPLRRLCLCAGVALAFAVGSTRIYLGVHWPTDVIGGWLVGAALAFAALGLTRR